MRPKTHVVEVWGDFACFTRPECKVERFSYPVPPPSAARGIFDAIYCKPNKDPSQAEFRWQITKIEILAPVSYIALRRNEVKDKANVSAILKWMSGKAEPEPLWADGVGVDTKGRTQRQTMALKSVRYRLHGEIRPWLGHEERLPAFEAQFQRRVERGKCFAQPCFGFREFPAYFGPPQPENAPVEGVNYDLGLMLYDVFDLSCPGTVYSAPCVSLFHAEVRNGIMEVPDYADDAVLKGAEIQRADKEDPTCSIN